MAWLDLWKADGCRVKERWEVDRTTPRLNVFNTRNTGLFTVQTFRVFKCDVGEGRRRWVRPILWEIKWYYLVKHIAKELEITPVLDKLLEYKRNWIQHINRMPRNRLPGVMKQYSQTGRRNHGRPPLKRLLDTWDRNGSTSGLTPWQTYDDDDVVWSRRGVEYLGYNIKEGLPTGLDTSCVGTAFWNKLLTKR